MLGEFWGPAWICMACGHSMAGSKLRTAASKSPFAFYTGTRSPPRTLTDGSRGEIMRDVTLDFVSHLSSNRELIAILLHMSTISAIWTSQYLFRSPRLSREEEEEVFKTHPQYWTHQSATGALNGSHVWWDPAGELRHNFQAIRRHKYSLCGHWQRTWSDQYCSCDSISVLLQPGNWEIQVRSEIIY